MRYPSKLTASLDPIRLLLVEDISDHADLIASIIQSYDSNIEIDFAETAAEGIRKAQEDYFDILLTDYRIGSVECFEMINDLRANNINFPIIILTGQGNEAVAAAAIGEGIEDYLIKDLVFEDSNQLIRSIHSTVEKHWLQKALKESEELYRTLIHNIREGVIVLRGSKLIFFNPSLAKILGIDPKKIEGKDFFELFIEEDRDKVMRFVDDAWKGRPVKESQFSMIGGEEKPIIHTSIAMNICTYAGERALIGSVKDITNRVIAEKKLRETLELTEKLSITDELTGLYNRRYALSALEKEIKRCRRYSSPLALIMLDLDLFKQINDIYGHLSGDEALIQVGEVLKIELRDVDTIARYGGDEFMIILPETKMDQAKSIAERIRSQVSKKIIASDSEDRIMLSISIGVAQMTSSDKSLTDLIRRADEGLLAAKNTGRNKVMIGPNK